MTCQRCGDEATVHLTEKVEGRLCEIHLCGRCAKKAGLPGNPLGLPPNFDAVIQVLIAKHVGQLVGDLARRRCPNCGTKFMAFRISGRLGCPRDYELFEPGLTPLIRRAHGTTRHVGKVPRRKRVAASNRLGLRARLRDAIDREDYEAAATLRDQLRQEDSDA